MNSSSLSCIILNINLLLVIDSRVCVLLGSGFFAAEIIMKSGGAVFMLGLTAPPDSVLGCFSPA